MRWNSKAPSTGNGRWSARVEAVHPRDGGCRASARARRAGRSEWGRNVAGAKDWQCHAGHGPRQPVAGLRRAMVEEGGGRLTGAPQRAGRRHGAALHLLVTVRRGLPLVGHRRVLAARCWRRHAGERHGERRHAREGDGDQQQRGELTCVHPAFDLDRATAVSGCGGSKSRPGRCNLTASCRECEAGGEFPWRGERRQRTEVRRHRRRGAAVVATAVVDRHRRFRFQPFGIPVRAVHLAHPCRQGTFDDGVRTRDP